MRATEGAESSTPEPTTPDRRLEYYFLDEPSVTIYPSWAADLRAVIAGFRAAETRFVDTNG